MTFDNDISDVFWETIENANKNRETLKAILIEKDKNTIYKFAGKFCEVSIALTDSRFLQYLGDLSEDATEDVCHWIVSQGKGLYQKIWDRPELISDYRDVRYQEILVGIAEEIFEDKFDEEIPETYNEYGYYIFNDIEL